MTFEEMLDQALAMLQRRGRVSYRASSSSLSWTMTSWRRSQTNSSTRTPR